MRIITVPRCLDDLPCQFPALIYNSMINSTRPSIIYTLIYKLTLPQHWAISEFRHFTGFGHEPVQGVKTKHRHPNALM